MARKTRLELLEDPEALASYQGWSAEVYRDLLAVARGELAHPAFDAKHLTKQSELVLDLTGFTETAKHGGAIQSFLRILEAQQL